MNMFTGADVKESLDQLAADFDSKESLDQLAADFDSNYQKNYAE